MNKIFDSFKEILGGVSSGATIMIDGFAGPGGTPQNLIKALRENGSKNLTVISNTAGLASVIGFGTIPGVQPVSYTHLTLPTILLV